MNSTNWAIVVLSYNHPQLTANCLASAAKFSLPLFCVHNGSNPEVIAKIQCQFPTVHHIVLPINKGYSGGANVGLNQVAQSFDWLIFLTNDCDLISLPKAQSPTGVLVPLIRKRSGKVDSAGGLWNRKTARLEHCWDFARWQNPKCHEWAFVPGSAFAIDRATWFAVGGFDENLFMYWEDVDWSQRLRLAGHPLHAAPEFEIRHGVGKTCRKLSHYTIYLYYRNQRWLHRRYTVHPIWNLNARYHLLTSWAKTSFRLIQSKRWQDLRSLARALRENP